ncbi:helix-turn-helix transcriptional regulator [Aminipila butyrica]|uniref:Helix-turn-helix transcriptional regulator n=1 Tax=Aminipila butyrica TaxID=433296 RepID=A0A858BXH0_9FIRM|nr:helix-turn-helix transcriptional regulator [Aminipila butyrica]
MMNDILTKSSSLPGVTLRKGPDSNELILHTANGEGRMVFYTLFSGIHLAYINVEALSWPESDTNAECKPLLINYCVSGRSELLLVDNTYIYMKGKDLSVSKQTAQKEYIFPTKNYEGLKMYFDLDLIDKESKDLLQSFDIDMRKLEQIYCRNGKTYIVEGTNRVEGILKRIWDLSEHPSIFHMRMYVLELIDLLLKDPLYSLRPCTFYTGVQVEIAKKAENILITNLHKHYPIKKLAERFSISETSLKNYFRGVYGQNISVYLREYRMNKGAQLLAETQKPISEISAQIGYTNQGKFAALFKQQFNMTPLEYRRVKRLEKI